MEEVGVRELKARLSMYLERAARGETIRVGCPVTGLGRSRKLTARDAAALLKSPLSHVVTVHPHALDAKLIRVRAQLPHALATAFNPLAPRPMATAAGIP